MDFTVINRLDKQITDWTVSGIIPAMLIYNRRELTEANDSQRNRPRAKVNQKERFNKEDDNILFDEISNDLPSY